MDTKIKTILLKNIFEKIAIECDRGCPDHMVHLEFLRGCGINTEYREITYPVVSSKPGKPWSPCTGAGCNHPSHEEAAAER